jgi:hypothetical protein
MDNSGAWHQFQQSSYKNRKRHPVKAGYTTEFDKVSPSSSFYFTTRITESKPSKSEARNDSLTLGIAKASGIWSPKSTVHLSIC